MKVTGLADCRTTPPVTRGGGHAVDPAKQGTASVRSGDSGRSYVDPGWRWYMFVAIHEDFSTLISR